MSDRRAKLVFYGGAGAVTGANFLLATGRSKILIDCGLEQGGEEAYARNREPFPYNPSDITSLVVTHAHLDHVGRIPKLIKDGFVGDIYSTKPTADLAALMFEDALSIMDFEQREHGVTPLYGRKDAEKALSLWRGREYHEKFAVSEEETCEFYDAGHVLGSAIVVLEKGGKRFAFTGDLGNTPAPVLRDTEFPDGISYMVMESVYGDRVHEDRDERKEILKDEIKSVHETKGVLLIPSFSIQRTQVLLYELNKMVENKDVPKVHVFLDSPLAARVTGVYRKYPEYLNESAKNELKTGDDVFDFPGLTVTAGASDSRSIENAPNPKVIIAGSGMSHGGRIRAHEKLYLKDENATILFVGYQAAGSLGRRIQDGAKRVKIDGKWVRVHSRVATLFGYSAHKDRDNLIDFAERVQSVGALEKVFVAMGEPHSSLFLTQRLRDFLGIDAVAPERGDTYTINW